MSFGDRTLLLKLALDTGNLESGMRGATSRMSRIGSQLKGFGIAFAANVAIAAVDELTDRIGAGISDAQAYRDVMLGLEAAWAGAGLEGGKLAAKVDAINAETLELGFDDVETLRVFQRYLDLTGDAEDAHRLLALTMDRARAENKDLNTAWSETTRLYRGGVRQLELFGLSAEEFGKKTASGMERAEAGLGRYESAAEEWANTSAGQWQRVNTMADRLFATLGEEILKLADEWMPVFMDEILPAMAEFWRTLEPMFQEIGGAIGELVSAIVEAEVIWKPILEVLAWLVGVMAAAWTRAVRTIARVIRWLSGVVKDWRKTVADVRDRIKRILDRISQLWDSWAKSIRDAIDTILRPLQDLERLLADIVGHLLGGAGDLLGSIGGAIGLSSTGASQAQVQAQSTGNVYMTVNGDPRTVEAAVTRAMGRRATRNGGIRVSNLNQHAVGLR